MSVLSRRRRDATEKAIDRRINKETAHLTYARVGMTVEATGWQFPLITLKVGDELKVFIDNVPKDLVDARFFGRVEPLTDWLATDIADAWRKELARGAKLV